MAITIEHGTTPDKPGDEILELIENPTETEPVVTRNEIEDDVLLSMRLLDDYQGARATWASNAILDSDFREGAQWTNEQKKELKRMKQNPIVVNVIYPAVEQAKASLTANSPTFSSTGREGSDVKVGSIFADLMSYVWYNSQGNVNLKQVCDDAYVKGMGMWCAYADPYADYGKGEVFIKSVDPLHVYVDPNSQDPFFRDAAHILLARVYTREQILNNWPQFASKINSATTVGSDVRKPVSDRQGDEGNGSNAVTSDTLHMKYDVIDRYTKVQVRRIHVYDATSGMEKILSNEEYEPFLSSTAILEETSGGQVYITDAHKLIEATQMLQRTGGTFHYVVDPNDPSGTPRIMAGPEDPDKDALMQVQTVPGSTVKLTQVTMADVLRAGVMVYNEIYVQRIKRCFSIGNVKVYGGILELEDYPIVPTIFSHNRNPYPQSPVRKVRPIQEYVNKLRSLIMAHASNSTNVKVALPRGSYNKNEVLSELGKAGVGILEFDAELGPLTIIGPVPLPNELYKNEVDARKDIQEIFGVYSFGQGDTSQAPTTYKGTIALDEFGQRRIKSMKDDVEASMNQLARVVIQLIQITYTEAKTIRIIRPNNTPLEFGVNQPVIDDISGEIVGRLNDITVGRYDLVTVAGSTLPTNRWARFEYYMQLYEKGIIDQYEVLKQTEVIDIEGVMKRADMVAKLQGALQQAQEKIKELSGDLQTASRESQHDRKRVEIEKFKSSLAEQSTKVAASASLFDARLKDELSITKRTVAEKVKARQTVQKKGDK